MVKVSGSFISSQLPVSIVVTLVLVTCSWQQLCEHREIFFWKDNYSSCPDIMKMYPPDQWAARNSRWNHTKGFVGPWFSMSVSKLFDIRESFPFAEERVWGLHLASVKTVLYILFKNIALASFVLKQTGRIRIDILCPEPSVAVWPLLPAIVPMAKLD